jgi:hypothetical protein
MKIQGPPIMLGINFTVKKAERAIHDHYKDVDGIPRDVWIDMLISWAEYGIAVDRRNRMTGKTAAARIKKGREKAELAK